MVSVLYGSEAMLTGGEPVTDLRCKLIAGECGAAAFREVAALLFKYA